MCSVATHGYLASCYNIIMNDSIDRVPAGLCIHRSYWGKFSIDWAGPRVHELNSFDIGATDKGNDARYPQTDEQTMETLR
jgi:hypothetical protein